MGQSKEGIDMYEKLIHNLKLDLQYNYKTKEEYEEYYSK